MLRNVYAALVEAHGFFSTKMDDPWSTEGNIVWLHLFVGTLSLQPCNSTREYRWQPSRGTLADECAPVRNARDAWIQANQDRYDGAEVCTIWNAFASRGLSVERNKLCRRYERSKWMLNVIAIPPTYYLLIHRLLLRHPRKECTFFSNHIGACSFVKSGAQFTYSEE